MGWNDLKLPSSLGFGLSRRYNYHELRILLFKVYNYEAIFTSFRPLFTVHTARFTSKIDISLHRLPLILTGRNVERERTIFWNTHHCKPRTRQ